MTQSSAFEDRIEVHSSRLWALVHFNMTLWVFPDLGSDQRGKLGRTYPLTISGLPKGQARYFVEHVRERLNEAPVTPPQQARR